MTSSNTSSLPPVVCILGPTAVGKTALALEAAKRFNGEIVSVDSRQFFRQLNIGTAKPTPEELRATPHHFIDFLDPDQTITAGQFERLALEKLDDIHGRGKLPIIAGGSGLYARILFEGMGNTPAADPELRKSLEDRVEQEGLETLVAELKIADPDYHALADLHNSHRVVRALEVFHLTGKPFSSFLDQPKIQRPYRWIKVVLTMERDQLYDRINQRVDIMVEQGLEQEVRGLIKFADYQSMQTIGYREWWPFLDGQSDLETVIDKIKQASRKYAKRQITWLQKETDAHSFDANATASAIDFIQEQLH